MCREPPRKPVLLPTLPLYVPPIGKKKSGPDPLEEGRGSQPLFRVEESERRKEVEAEVGGEKKRGTEID